MRTRRRRFVPVVSGIRQATRALAGRSQGVPSTRMARAGWKRTRACFVRSTAAAAARTRIRCDVINRRCGRRVYASRARHRAGHPPARPDPATPPASDDRDGRSSARRAPALPAASSARRVPRGAARRVVFSPPPMPPIRVSAQARLRRCLPPDPRVPESCLPRAGSVSARGVAPLLRARTRAVRLSALAVVCVHASRRALRWAARTPAKLAASCARASLLRLSLPAWSSPPCAGRPEAPCRSASLQPLPLHPSPPA